ncbi:trypsin-like peptidase domain-containing protein [Mycobacterium sp. 1274761.0]|uniref:trypsin-like peptidase domain-containing protein n=1 Tax=Mycobacterium sp. 1274761.0 TaxID=1834077 RepID=UPI000AB00C99|nr:trypsin-like peptidase domain-containing protein [Mycobacterium sp. 1274761.0]
MKLIRVLALTVAMVVAVTGCGGIGDTVRRLTHPTTAHDVEPAASTDGLVAKARPSVVKVHGESQSCWKVTDGSGFVVAPHKVMTNAHVVAGAESFSVAAETKSYGAQVVSYDPQADIAILDVPDLAAEPLEFAEYTAGTGTDALVLGYPGAASFTASPVQVRQVIDLNGPDIYRATIVTREVYLLVGSFAQSGASGSALVDLYGHVLGVFFGAGTNDSTTGFAMTAEEVAPQMARVHGRQPADTGGCVI